MSSKRWRTDADGLPLCCVCGERGSVRTRFRGAVLCAVHLDLLLGLLIVAAGISVIVGLVVVGVCLL